MWDNGNSYVYFWACINNNPSVLPDFTKFFQGITKVALCNTIHQTPNMDNHRWKRLVWILISLKCQTFNVTCILFCCGWASNSRVFHAFLFVTKTTAAFCTYKQAFCSICTTIALQETRARLKMGEGWLIPSWLSRLNHNNSKKRRLSWHA